MKDKGQMLIANFAPQKRDPAKSGTLLTVRLSPSVLSLGTKCSPKTVRLSPSAVSGSAVSGSAEPLGIEPRDEMLAELFTEVCSPNGSTERLGSEPLGIEPRDEMLAELFTEVCSPNLNILIT
ncbi:MAG: hypothetical protein Q7J55_05145 [bacterium]|nr:hypothetical protein [bacterium]